MKDTDFDHLGVGAPPEEARRLRKILTEWARGEEDSFPVQLALLTRAQWRSAATVPRLVENDRRALEETMARAKAEFAASAQAVQDALRTGVTQLQLEVTHQSTGIKNVAASINVHLGTANAVAHDIRVSLEEEVGLDRAKEKNCSPQMCQVNCRKRIASFATIPKRTPGGRIRRGIRPFRGIWFSAANCASHRGV